jgi:predicted TPR repeat methyltransferase
VLIYFGDLDPLFAALAASLRPGGVLVATLEALDDADERDIVLQVHGRYAHRRGYAEAMLERHGLRVERFVREVLRTELAEPVHGWLFSAVKAA